ncbi:MAG: transposase, partial [Chloroflexi bacterium]|nr:transposase [Chloroflexota bacterium]
MKGQLLAVSASAIDRLLRPFRQQPRSHGMGTTKPGTLLKGAIPLRTFSEWDERKPGFLEIDLVAHCGTTTEGFYLHTLSTVDIATGWVEVQGVWGKGQDRVGSAIHT